MDRFAEKYYSVSPYAYVANNPMRNIDVNGDSIWFSYRYNKNELVGVTMNVSGKVLNDSNNNVNMKKAVSSISGAISDAFKGKVDGVKFSTNVMLTAVNGMDEVCESDHLFVLTDKFSEIKDGGIEGAANMFGGKVAFVDSDFFVGPYDVAMGKHSKAGWNAAHEFGHLVNLKHERKNPFNLMRQNGSFRNINNSQLKQIYQDYQNGYLNLGRNYELNLRGQKRPNRGEVSIYIRP